MSEPITNPYKKGKSKLIGELMLEGWNNDKIYNHIRDNKLDERFSNPVSLENIYQVRTRFNQKGITEKMRELKEKQEKIVITPEKELPEIPEGRYAIEVLTQSDEQGEVADTDEKITEHYPQAGRPEWDLLTVEQINNIEDPTLRTRILEHRSYREKIKQEMTPDYATKEQFDTFKTEIQGSLSEIVETLNKMKTNNPTPQAMKPEVAIADTPEIADVSDPTMDLETENPLEATTDSVIELEGSIISRKTVGFTPKSLMLYDLTRKKGFRGNFADFVNSCISSALKGRKFKLTVEEDVK